MKGKQFLSTILATLLLVLALPAAKASAEDYSPEMMPNVQKADRREYVSDPAGLMSAEAKMKVNDMLYRLRQQTSVEAVVAIPPSIGDTPIEDWSEQLFTLWGIGKKDNDNGVLLVIAPEQRKARIQTGYGMEGVLPDIACRNIIDQEIIPNMRANNLDAAVAGACSLIVGAATDPEAAAELKSGEADNYSDRSEMLSPDILWKYARIVATAVFIFALIVFIRNMFAVKGLDNYHKAEKWRASLSLFIWTSIFSMGSGLIFLLGAFLLYRSYRTRRRKCPTCGTRMRRLSENEDNELLSASQDFEENLDTVDYDVWECPKCGTIERFAFKKKQMKYTECPDCHTIAMCKIGDRTIQPATTRSKGIGESIYECQFCHHQRRSRFVIPKKEDPSAAIAAAAVLGSMSGRGGGGGGFGGGFGGGSTGGGGASGGW